MVNIYKYLFYRIYLTIKNLNKKTDTIFAAHNSVLIISFLIAINLDTLKGLFSQINEWRYNRISIYIVFFIIYIINLFIFLRIINYKKIEENFSNESGFARIFSKVLTIIFIIVTLLPVILKLAK
jgi:hypothetical protein